MDLNLITTEDSSLKNQVDWGIFEEKLKSFYIIDSNYTFFKPNLKYPQIFDETQALLTEFSTSDIYEDILHLNHIIQDNNPDQILSRIYKQGYTSTEELNIIANIIESHFIFKNIQDVFKLDYDFNSIKKEFLTPFRLVVNKSGDFDFNKHPEIKNLFKNLTDKEHRIRAQLKRFQSNNSSKNLLQFEGHDVIDNFYVLAIKSDSYNNSIGKIISRSESGNTLYIAPYETLNLNYEIKDIQHQIETLIFEWNRHIASSLSPFQNDLNQLYYYFKKFDDLQARARFAQTFNLNKPSIGSDFLLKDIAHPLIENPVPNTIQIPAEKKGLVISGPNTGGKSITLKNICLSALFTKLGLYIPASDSTVRLYDNIYYLSQDGQSLTDGVSSFASEVIHFSHIFENLGETNLIIIDEIF
jgi:DNA mismatch repair protein MutS2